MSYKIEHGHNYYFDSIRIENNQNANEWIAIRSKWISQAKLDKIKEQILKILED